MIETKWPVFERALKREGVLDALLSGENVEFLSNAALRYNRDKPDLVEPMPGAGLPKTIHQIWLGGSVPAKLQGLSKTWRERHPDWAYRLWTDDDVDALTFETRDLFDRATCWGQKSDLLRAEILLQYGGVYVDLDYINYQTLDDLADRYTFFGTLRNIFPAYIGWRSMWRSPVIACNSLFGARAGHPILKRYLEQVRQLWDREDLYKYEKGELPSPAVLAMGGAAKATRIKETGSRTYLPFHDVVSSYLADADDRFLILPPVFFNPLMDGARMLYLMPDFWQLCRQAGLKWPRVSPYNTIMPYSIACHLSKNSWL